MNTAAKTTSAPADPRVVGLALSRGAEVVVLALREHSSGAVYSEGTIMLVKQLRAEGVDAAYLHDSDARVFEAKKSAVAEVVWIPLAVGLVTNATWDLIKRVLRRVDARRLKVDYTSLETDAGRATTWAIEGDTEAVIEALDRLRESDGQ